MKGLCGTSQNSGIFLNRGVGRKKWQKKVVQSLIEVTFSKCLVTSLALKGPVALPKMDPLLCE